MSALRLNRWPVLLCRAVENSCPGQCIYAGPADRRRARAMTPHSAWLLLTVAGLTCCHRLRGAGASFCDFADSYPRQLIAFRAGAPPVIDGRLDEPVWEEVEWSESFVDISRAAPPRFSTRVKIRWDDEWLYVGALLSEPDTWANITEHDAVRNHGGDRRATVRRGGHLDILSWTATPATEPAPAGDLP